MREIQLTLLNSVESLFTIKQYQQEFKRYEKIEGSRGSEGNAYFAYMVREGGGSKGKMLILLM